MVKQSDLSVITKAKNLSISIYISQRQKISRAFEAWGYMETEETPVFKSDIYQRKQ